MDVRTIEAGGVVLRPLRDGDSDPMFRWINDRELVVFNAPFAPVPRDRHDAWFEQVRRRPDVRIFAIDEAATGRFVGSCQLLHIQERGASADLQIRIGERQAWSRGLGTDAVRALVAYGFDDLHLRQIALDVRADNARAIRVYEKCGFRPGHLQRGAVVIEGAPVDLLRMAVTAP